jgi:hypothetical protein
MPLTRKRGRYWYGFTRVNGVSSREQSTGCADRIAAEKVVDEWERDAADPDRAAQRRETLDSALNSMLKNCRELSDARPPKLAKATVTHYEGKARVVKTVFASLVPPVTLLQQVDHPTLSAYITARRALGTSEHTIGKELTVIRMTVQRARANKLFTLHWEDLLPGGFSSGYEPDLTFLRPEPLSMLLAELLPDHAARAAWMVGTSGEWSASVRALRADVNALNVHVRGSKRETRDRIVPLVMGWQRELVDFALEHGQGKDGYLFSGFDPAAFTHALYRACGALEARRRATAAVVTFLGWGADLAPAPAAEAIPRVSSNDLRRTFGMWMRAQGVAVSEIGLMMGHRDSRMVERVYARIPADLLHALLQSLVRQPAAEGIPAQQAEVADMAKDLEPNPLKLAPRAGFEPATYGLTGLGIFHVTPRYDRENLRSARPHASGLPSAFRRLT